MCSTESKLLGEDGHDALQFANPFSETIRFQSSQPHLKRFMMFDQSGGKGRVFFHPALAQHMFSLQSGRSRGESHKAASGSGELLKKVPDTEEANAKRQAFRRTVSEAFDSLQMLRSSRQSDMQATSTAPPCIATAASATSGSMQENTEELDALLSSDQEEDEDEEVRSTGHSPDQRSREEIYGSEGEEQSSKRVKLEQQHHRQQEQQHHHHQRKQHHHHHQQKQQQQELVQNHAAMANSKEREDKVQKQEPIRERGLHQISSTRRLKIKRTVKTLRRMIPGGSYMDPALVLDQTILYVKTLRDRVRQLETSRFPSLP